MKSDNSHKNDFKDLAKQIIKFRNDRDWEKFHNSKDLSLALSIEVAELNELFLWKNSEEVDVEKLSEELADIFIYALMISEKHNLDVREIVLSKLELNNKKYPIDKSRGKSDKYNVL
ncbi:MAG: nucleotide pyrophosphohydrolase [SAR202 cluster bacterium]|nr:nucleotide pyrophosphohydrolase [SAR202 cluster bacterium]